jgi:2-polyprenyl-3-methyl-5-hydroxy-6-metoxy-1,4-benzoquinol methylase
MKKWYEKLFENYGLQYDNEVFVQGTSGECDFIEKEIGYFKNCRILDIGCGTGRHSIELSKRGYNVTGIDLSESMLNVAKAKALEYDLLIDFRNYDARNLPFIEEFDIAIMICEGAFPLMETDEMNYQILNSATRSLKKGGKLILTTLNGLFPLFHSVKDFLTGAKKEGGAVTMETSFDLMTFRDFNRTTIADDSGAIIDLECNERYYVPSEITWLLTSLGFGKVEIFGAKLGAFSRNDKLTTEDFEMLVIAEKAT